MWHVLILNINQIHWLPYLDSYLYLNAMLRNTDSNCWCVCLSEAFKKMTYQCKNRLFLIFFIEKHTHDLHKNALYTRERSHRCQTWQPFQLHNERVNQVRNSMIETLQAASRGEDFNILCVERVAFCSNVCFGERRADVLEWNIYNCITPIQVHLV